MLLSIGSSATLAGALELDQALHLAASKHPSVEAKRSERQAALMKLDMAERQQYPGLVAQSAKDAYGRPSTTLRLEQPLWTGGRITGEISAAQATIRQADASVLQAQQELMFKVVTAFTELGRIQDREVAARSNVAEHTRLAQMIQRRVDAQVSPASDGIQAGARLSQAKAEWNQLQAQALRARSSLSQATGVVVTEVARPRRPDPGSAQPGPWIDAAMAYSPTLRRLQAEYEAATADIEVRHGNALPQVKMRIDRTFGGAAGGTQVYVALDYQTGNGFSALASEREAVAKREAVRSEIEAARLELTESVNAEWADLQSLSAQINDLKAQLDGSTAVFASFMRQFAVGRKGWNEVLNAQREIAQTSYQVADAEWAALKSAFRLHLLTGVITAEPLAPSPQPPHTTASLPMNGANERIQASPALPTPSQP